MCNHECMLSSDITTEQHVNMGLSFANMHILTNPLVFPPGIAVYAYITACSIRPYTSVEPHHISLGQRSDDVKHLMDV